MSIELPKDKRQEALASIVRYFSERREEEIGQIAASGLLDFFMEEIAPSIYNQAVADLLERLQMHIAELDLDFEREEFQYWRDRDPKSKKK
jgi:uncharacterized protein (DUF2164 family)